MTYDPRKRAESLTKRAGWRVVNGRPLAQVQKLRRPADEYDALVEALRQDFPPQTAAEELLIQQMASASWRRQRLVKAEKARIESKVFNAPFEFDSNDYSQKEQLETELADVYAAAYHPKRPKETAQKIKHLADTHDRRKELYVLEQVSPDLDALAIRYDSSSERQFYRALVMLLKIQAVRKGKIDS